MCCDTVEEDMRRVVVFLVISCFQFAPCWCAENRSESAVDFSTLTLLDLPTAQKVALQDNPGIAAARARFAQARARVKQASAAWWPNVNLNGQLKRSRRSDTVFEALAQRETTPRRYVESSGASLEATWVLFDGFYRSFFIDQMEADKESAGAARLDSQRRLLSAVAEAFFNAQLIRTREQIASADNVFYAQQLRDANSRFEAGTGTWGDVLNIKVQLNQAQTTRLLEHRQYEAAMYGLAALLGVEDGAFPETIQLEEMDSTCTGGENDEDIAQLIKNALASRPDIRQLGFQVAAGKAAIGRAKAIFWPKVQLGGAVDGGQEQGYELTEDDFGNYIALNVSWRLFSGGADRARVLEERLKLREREFALKELRNTVTAEVRQYVALLQAAREQVRLQQETVTLVEENRQIASREYEAGVTSLVRLNEAQKDLNTTHNRLAQALVSFHLARQRLLAATGQNLGLFGEETAGTAQPVIY